jgi:hypothetical protein
MESIEVISTAVVGEGQTEIALTLPPLEPEELIELRAFDPTGAPVERFEFSLKRWCEETWTSVGFDIVHRSDDSLWIRPVSPETAALGELWLSVSADDFGMRVVRVDSPSIAVRFETPAILHLDVGGSYADEDDGDAILTADRGGWSRDWRLTNVTRPFAPVQPGDYELALLVGDDHAFEPFRVLLASGENRIALAVPPRSTIEVELRGEHVTGGVEIVRAEGWLDDRYERDAVFEGKRVGDVIRFEGIFDGEYALLFVDRARRTAEVMPITVRGDASVLFRGAPLRAFLVRSSEDRPQDDRRIRDGDLVIGMDGEEFSSPAEVLETLALLDSSLRLALLVERPGVGRIDVDFAEEWVPRSALGWPSTGRSHLVPKSR